MPRHGGICIYLCFVVSEGGMVSQRMPRNQRRRAQSSPRASLKGGNFSVFLTDQLLQLAIDCPIRTWVHPSPDLLCTIANIHISGLSPIAPFLRPTPLSPDFSWVSWPVPGNPCTLLLHHSSLMNTATYAMTLKSWCSGLNWFVVVCWTW